MAFGHHERTDRADGGCEGGTGGARPRASRGEWARESCLRALARRSCADLAVYSRPPIKLLASRKDSFMIGLEGFGIEIAGTDILER